MQRADMVRNRNRTLLLAVDTHSALDKQSHYVQLYIDYACTHINGSGCIGDDSNSIFACNERQIELMKLE